MSEQNQRLAVLPHRSVELLIRYELAANDEERLKLLADFREETRSFVSCELQRMGVSTSLFVKARHRKKKTPQPA